jgi:hypothetical protein
MTGRLLPDGFEPLEPFVAAWAIASVSERATLRGRATAAERRAFYAVASGLLERALDYLDAKPLASLDDGEQRLMQLMLSLAHVALAEETLGDDEPEHARLRAFMPITREAPETPPADGTAGRAGA